MQPTEIRNLVKYPGSVGEGLVGFWPLWGSSSVEPDYSGFQDNGVVTGAVRGNSDPPVNGIFQVNSPGGF